MSFSRNIAISGAGFLYLFTLTSFVWLAAGISIPMDFPAALVSAVLIAGSALSFAIGSLSLILGSWYLDFKIFDSIAVSRSIVVEKSNSEALSVRLERATIQAETFAALIGSLLLIMFSFVIFFVVLLLYEIGEERISSLDFLAHISSQNMWIHLFLVIMNFVLLIVLKRIFISPLVAIDDALAWHFEEALPRHRIYMTKHKDRLLSEQFLLDKRYDSTP